MFLTNPQTCTTQVNIVRILGPWQTLSLWLNRSRTDLIGETAEWPGSAVRYELPPTWGVPVSSCFSLCFFPRHWHKGGNIHSAWHQCWLVLARVRWSKELAARKDYVFTLFTKRCSSPTQTPIQVDSAGTLELRSTPKFYIIIYNVYISFI